MLISLFPFVFFCYASLEKKIAEASNVFNTSRLPTRKPCPKAAFSAARPARSSARPDGARVRLSAAIIRVSAFFLSWSWLSFLFLASQKLLKALVTARANLKAGDVSSFISLFPFASFRARGRREETPCASCAGFASSLIYGRVCSCLSWRQAFPYLLRYVVLLTEIGTFLAYACSLFLLVAKIVPRRTSGKAFPFLFTGKSSPARLAKRAASSVEARKREKGGGTQERVGKASQTMGTLPLGRFYYMYSRLPKTEI